MNAIGYVCQQAYDKTKLGNCLFFCINVSIAYVQRML